VFFFLFPEWIVTLSGKDISFNKVTVSGGDKDKQGRLLLTCKFRSGHHSGLLVGMKHFDTGQYRRTVP
jgi:hypothetical protein